MSTIDIWETDTELFTLGPTEYKKNNIVFKDDPLVCAVVYKEIYDTAYYRVTDDRLAGMVTQDHRDTAAKIKSYYGKKLMWASIKDDTALTEFRKKALTLIHSDTNEVNEKDVGIFVKLVWMYYEDQFYDQLASKYQTVNIPGTSNNVESIDIQLDYVGVTERWISRKRYHFFWFKDDKGYIYSVQLEASNPLLAMFKSFACKDNVLFETRINWDHAGEHEFYKMHQFLIKG